MEGRHGAVLQPQGVVSAAKTSVVPAAKTSVVSAAKTSLVSAAKTSAVSAAGHLWSPKISQW